MLYKQGYCSLRGEFPSHLSTQNRTWDPSLQMSQNEGNPVSPS
jgi:hypothetical protein